MVKLKVSLVLMVLLVMWPAACESSSGAVAEDRESKSAQDAKQSTGMHPKASLPEDPPPPFEKDAPGISERACVEVNPLLEKTSRSSEIQSGEFIAGNFDLYLAEWAPNPQHGKIWWIPLHTDRMPGVKVVAPLLDKPSIRRTYRFSGVGYAGYVSFYPSDIPLPKSGAWRLIAISGPDRGCFELTLPG